MRATPLASLAFAAGLALLVPAIALAEPTEITIRVLSKDGKFVGTSMGGARVILRDADTGEILAQGVTAGGTGDTARIMHARRRPPCHALRRQRRQVHRHARSR